jgi:enoyl-CoA hydratase/carnithine racemase
MDYQYVLYEKTGPVATITLNRPEVLNAISPELEAELHQALDEADADGSVRAVILTGAGRAFSSGYDMGPKDRPEAATLDPTGLEPAEFIRRWWQNDLRHQQNLLHIWYLSKPVIAAVHGWVLGGGLWYALACDITIAAENAVFGQPEVRHAANTTFLVAALAGWKAAQRYALTGDHFDAWEAYRLGLVNEVVPLDALMPRARELAERIARVSPASVRFNRAITFLGLLASGLGAGMLMNAALSTLVHASHDAFRAALLEALQTGGLKAFLEARDGPFRPEPFGPRSAPPAGER